MNYRSLIYFLAALGTAAVLHAPESVNSTAQSNERHTISLRNHQTDIRLESVDDILRGTGFIPVCSANIESELANSKGILFFYNNGSGVGYQNGAPINYEASKAMAESLRMASAEMRSDIGIKLLKFDADCDPPNASENYWRLLGNLFGLPPSPYLVLFRDGGIIPETGTNGKAPSFDQDSLEEWKKTIKAIVLIDLFLR